MTYYIAITLVSMNLKISRMLLKLSNNFQNSAENWLIIARGTIK